MIGTKRARPSADDQRPHEQPQDSDSQPRTAMPPPPKRRKVAEPHTPSRTGRDLLSPLSDELLVRILAFLPLQHLLAVAPVSRRFYRLAADSQLWKALYYARFVLPRAMRIPGFRDTLAGATGGGAGGGHRLHYSGRRTLWADGRRGGVVRGEEERTLERGKVEDIVGRAQAGEEEVVPQAVDWKRQFKIRCNWARGKCAVEELKLGEGLGADGGEGRKMLVKVVDGVAVTADKEEGLRAWDLKTRSLIAHIGIGGSATPSCITVDDAELEQGVLNLALGFTDGSFGVWRLFTSEKRLAERYRHGKSTNGELMAVAFSYPYFLTATQSVLVSLYTFELPSASEAVDEARDTSGQNDPDRRLSTKEDDGHTVPGTATSDDGDETTQRLSAPYLLTSLDSHTSRPPLALSIRKTAKTTVASVAYTFSTRRGWSIGIQDLHIRQPATGIKSTPEITTTRLAFTTPVDHGGVSHSPTTSLATPRRGRRRGTAEAESASTTVSDLAHLEPGPTTLCYTHPYLLATLPDNTLVLHMCTSNTSSLSISDGIRLWGHTSGISDAEITARGKAVSVSTRGEEMRVWELEGRSAGVGSRSVEIRPWQSLTQGEASSSLAGDGLGVSDPARDWDERRNWVGFDDEMVIVLQERKGTRESLMVYDFT